MRVRLPPPAPRIPARRAAGSRPARDRNALRASGYSLCGWCLDGREGHESRLPAFRISASPMWRVPRHLERVPQGFPQSMASRPRRAKPPCDRCRYRDGPESGFRFERVRGRARRPLSVECVSRGGTSRRDAEARTPSDSERRNALRVRAGELPRSRGREDPTRGCGTSGGRLRPLANPGSGGAAGRNGFPMNPQVHR